MVFQSTHPRRVWLKVIIIRVMITLFQSTHPRRVWHQDKLPKAKYLKFQSTHPRRVWPTDGQRSAAGFLVSIHTPTKGVTLCSSCIWGRSTCFNPHTHEGCDVRIWSLLDIWIVSIHTPTKGVTWCFCLSPKVPRVSIHTPTKGVTLLVHVLLLFASMFQSTHPRRVWLIITSGYRCAALFQSTHPRRVWLAIAAAIHITAEVSIHTPTKGVTLKKGTKVFLRGFNPHTHEGCDILLQGSSLTQSKFQSTHPRRVWPKKDY